MPDTARLTWSLGIELVAVHNVDLFRRGHYRVHLAFAAPESGSVELSLLGDVATIEGQHAACVSDDGRSAISTSVLIQYRQQRKLLADTFTGHISFNLPTKKLLDVRAWPALSCALELHHAPNDGTNRAPPPSAFTKVSRRRLALHMCPSKHQLHSHRPFLFDFCHLAGVQLRVHCVLSGIGLAAGEPSISEKPKSGLRSAVRNLLPSSAEASGFRRSNRASPFRSHSFRMPDRPHRSRRGSEFTEEVANIVSKRHQVYRLEVLPITEAIALCRLLLESKAALADAHQLLIGCPPPPQPDVDELLRKMFRKGKRDAIPWSDAYDYIAAISSEIDTLWQSFQSDMFEVPAAIQRLLFQCQHRRILRWREGILTQLQPVSQCLAMDVQSLPGLTAIELQNFAAKMTTDTYGKLAFEQLPLSCKGVDGTHRDMPLILEQIFSGPDPALSSSPQSSPRKGIPSDQSRTSICSDGQPMLTLLEFLGSGPKTMSRRSSSVSVASDQSTGEMMTLREFLSSGLQKRNSSATPSDHSAGGDEMLTLDEFMTILANGMYSAKDDEGESPEPVLSVDEFLSSVTPACAKALLHRNSSSSGREKFTVDELLAVFDASRATPRPSMPEDSDFGISLCDFLGGSLGSASGALLASEEVASMDDFIMAEKEDAYKGQVVDMVDMTVPSCRPPISTHLRRINQAKDSVRSCLPSSWSFLSDGPPVSLPLPYFSTVEAIHVKSKPVHLVVCVHGLEGLHLDLRMFSVYLRLALPEASLVFLKSRTNENNTNNDFNIMIECLVEEILTFVEDKELLVSKLSFVGHSLGNIIIRGALAHPALKNYLPKLQVYISFAGPHLGTMHANSVVSTGMWLMRKWKKSQSLCQLAMKDATNKRECFLYQLSLKPGLALFKSVLLVASHQDQYVPFHSAHVAVHSSPDAEDLGRIHTEMVQNLLRPLQYSCTELRRYTVVYHFQSTVDVNVLVGRAGHVAVLDNDLFLEKFVSLFCASKFQNEPASSSSLAK